MTEELSGMAVPSADVSVAIDPALLNKPIRPEEQQFGGADADALNHKLGLERQHRKNAEKKAADAALQLQQLQQEVEQLKTVQQSAVQTKASSVSYGTTQNALSLTATPKLLNSRHS